MITCWTALKGDHTEAAKILRYPDAIELLKWTGTERRSLVRDPVPERLMGDPNLIQDLIGRLPFKRRFQLVTLSFAQTDIPVAAFNAGEGAHRTTVGNILALFTETAFAGIAPELRPPLFVNTHTHTGRLEVNIVIPQMPGQRALFATLRDPSPGMASARRGVLPPSRSGSCASCWWSTAARPNRSLT